MGITRGFFRLLIDMRKQGVLQGTSILQLGRQNAFFTFQEAVQSLEESGMPIPDVKPELAIDKTCKNRGGINDVTLFALLGFNTVHSLDISDYEEATHIRDLNSPNSEKLPCQYDVVYDGGTLEHIFSTLHALKNIHSYLKIDGTVIHVNPIHNHLDHGFYSFSPQMYSDYYTTNSYKILGSYILETFKNGYEDFNLYKYNPGQLETLQFGGYGREMLCMWHMAQKQSHSTAGQIPHQGCSRTEYPPLALPPEVSTFTSRSKKWFKNFKSLYSLAKKAKNLSISGCSWIDSLKKKIHPVGVRRKLEFLKKY